MSIGNSQNFLQITPSSAHQLTEIKRIGSGSIRSLAYSPDGQFLAAGSSIGVWLYDAELKNPPRLLGKDECGYRVAFSSDNKLLASMGQNNEIWVWETHSGEVHSKIKLEVEDHHLATNALAWHPIDNLIATGGWDETTRLVNVDTDEVIKTLPMGEPITSLAFSVDGSFLAIGLWKNKSRLLWMLDYTYIELPRLSDVDHGENLVAFSSDGKFAYGKDNIVALWDIHQKKTLHRFYFRDQGLEDIAFSHSGTMLATANWAGPNSAPGKIRIFDLNTYQEHIIASAGGVSVTFRPDNKVLAYAKGGWNSTIELYERETGNLLYTPAHGCIAGDLALTDDGKSLAIGMSRGIITVIDSYSGEQLHQLAKKDFDPSVASGGPISFYPDSNSIIFSGFDHGTKYYSWNLASQAVTDFEPDEAFTLNYLMTILQFNPSNKTLIIGAPYWVEAANRMPIKDNASQYLVFDAAITKDETVTVTALVIEEPASSSQFSKENFIGANVETLIQGWSPTMISLSVDGNFVAGAGHIGSGNKTTSVGWVWDIEQKQLKFSFKASQYYGAEMKGAVFTADGRLSFFVDGSGQAYLWDVEQGILILQFKAHASDLWDFAVNPDGRQIITLGSDGTVRFWGVLLSDTPH